ncbi:MAG: response regulator, partial [bacterium]|nr:response regulator [bacterium]
NKIIDKSKLFSGEFKILADSANEMLTRRQEMEKSLQESRERLAVTFRSIGEGVITTDTKGNVVLINRVAEQMTGWKQENALGKPLDRVFRIVSEKNDDTLLICGDGKKRIITQSTAPIRDTGNRVIGVVMVFQDITEKRRMEQEAQRAQKLESLGLLAGGIAHDFNNLLTGILGNISLAKMHSGNNENISRPLKRSEHAVSRTRNLTQQLLTFAVGGEPMKKTLSIVHLVEESVSLSLRGSRIKCETSLPGELWSVEADEGQLSQVFNNLLINASQAMPEGGIVQITAENLSLGQSSETVRKDGKYVKICVKDNGIGIPAENLQKIFDPYFTTREKGSGLGLASSYSIVLKHHGYINVESKVGEGTVFCVYLPALGKKTAVAKEREDAVFKGGGRVLVIDDEEMLLAIAGDMLHFLGYESEVAFSGGQALEMYKQAKTAGNPFDVVIMDLTIPGGMGGEEAIKKLLELDPDAAVIVSSGYSNSPVMANFANYGFKACIMKPYRIETLSHILQKVG